MTTGQMLFYSGVGLMVITLLTAIVFSVKKPQYKPEKVADSSAAISWTEKSTGSGERHFQSGQDTVELLQKDDTQLLENDATQLLEDDQTQLL